MSALTKMQAAVWRRAEQIHATREYAQATRNRCVAVRESFARDQDVPGTRAWAIGQMLVLGRCDKVRLADFSDDVCAKILAATE